MLDDALDDAVEAVSVLLVALAPGLPRVTGDPGVLGVVFGLCDNENESDKEMG